MWEMMPIINSPNKGHPDNNKGFIKIREVNKHGIILQRDFSYTGSIVSDILTIIL